MSIEKLKKDYGIAVQWRAFPLHPEIPEEGLSLERLFAGRPINVDESMRRLRGVAADLGLPFGERKKTFNSRLAQELGLWAESKNRGDPFHMAAFKAYFAEGKNLAEIVVLVDLAESVGLSGEEASHVLAARTFKAAVDADWALARERAITAVPTLLMNGERLIGAQPYSVLEGLMKANGVEKRDGVQQIGKQERAHGKP